MILRRIFVIAFALFTVTLNTACPRDIAATVAEETNLRKEYDDKYDERTIVDRELYHEYSIFVNSSFSSSKTVDWSKYNQTQLARIRTLLTKYLTLTGRLIELADHKAVKETKTNYTRTILREEQASASGFLSSMP